MLGSGSADPFVAYPVSLAAGEEALVDHCRSTFRRGILVFINHWKDAPALPYLMYRFGQGAN